ncbi:hypothetical protein EV361DRAFT_905191 [Lentinula raphanica]|nr:hypothetical protein F5880DRAFT_660698 [Lentinula raphanica]KAJ3972496.1 hypothetical protein EV361DRAFT_905191 [Lentinula raphanica]
MLLKPFTILASSIVFASLFESVSPLPINENAPVYDPYYNSFDTPIYKFTASKGVPVSNALTPNALVPNVPVPNHPILPPQSSIDPNWMPDDTRFYWKLAVTLMWMGPNGRLKTDVDTTTFTPGDTCALFIGVDGFKVVPGESGQLILGTCSSTTKTKRRLQVAHPLGFRVLL